MSPSVVLQPVFAMAMLFLAFSALGVSGWESPHSISNLIYWYLLPSLPFVLLALLSFALPRQIGPLSGAAVGAVVAVGLPWGMLWYDSSHYDGGGANIGLGLLLLAMPIYLPLCMILGYCAAKLCRRTVGGMHSPRGGVARP